MDPEEQWSAARGESARMFGIAGMGILRITLLFGSAAVALALIIAPIAESQTRTQISDSGLDRMTTGSVSGKGSYTIRRSVLQNSPTAICVIRDNGSRSGDCH